MEISKHSTGTLTARVKVTVAPEDYKDKVETVLKDYAKRANIKGFRKGHVPVSVVRKMFGKGIVVEELNKVISSSLNNYLVQEQIPMVGEPLPLSKDLELKDDTDSTYDFEYEIGFANDITPNYGAVQGIPLNKVTVDPEILDREVEDLRSRHGETINPEESQEGDVLYGKLSAAGADGGADPEGLSKMTAINPTRVNSEVVKVEMAKPHKAGDTFTVMMADIFQNDNEIRRFWETNVQGERLRTIEDAELDEIKAKPFVFEVKKVNRIVKMELGPDLYNKVFGEEAGITDEEGFRNRVSGDMEAFFQREALRQYRSKAIRGLVEESGIELPDEFLRKWLIQTREQVTEGNIDEIYPSYARSLRWRLLIEAMQKLDPSIAVTEEHIRDRARQMVMSQFAGLVGDDDPSRLDAFADYYLKDEKMVERMFDETLEDHVFTHLWAQNPPSEEPVTATAFLEVLKSER